MIKHLIGALAVAANLLTGMTSEVQAKTEMKIGNAFATGSIITNAVHELCDVIKERTSGEYTLVSYDDSKLGPVPAQVKLLNAGNLNFIVSSSGNLSSFIPKIDALDMPGIVRYHSNMASVLNGKTSQEIYEAASNKNILILGAFASAPRVFMLTRPVKTLEEAKGLKLRVTPSKIHLATIQKLGMTPVPLAWPECYTSLQQNVIEGVDPELAQGIASSFLGVAPHWSKFDITPMTAVVIVNRKWWDKLPEADRKVIHDAIIDVGNKNITKMFNDDIKLLEKLSAEGHPVFVPSDEERNRWIEAVKDIYKDFKHIPSEWIEKLRDEYASLK